jgi:hypothetical protein
MPFDTFDRHLGMLGVGVLLALAPRPRLLRRFRRQRPAKANLPQLPGENEAVTGTPNLLAAIGARRAVKNG